MEGKKDWRPLNVNGVAVGAVFAAKSAQVI